MFDRQTLFIPSFYLPPISYFAEIVKSECITIVDHELYQKKSFRNRCEIYSANGKIQLSIPLETGRNSSRKLIMREVKLSFGTDWKKNHLASIKSAYGRSPYFEYYADDIFEIYKRKHTFLLDFNTDILKQLAKSLKILLEINTKQDNHFNINTKQDNHFNINTSENREKEYNFPKYYQSFSEKHGFLSDLSIIDLLFHQGSAASKYLNELKIRL